MPGNPVKRRLAINAGLLGAILILGAAVLLAPDGKTPSPRLIEGLERDRIERIRIEPRGGESIALEKSGTGWRMLEPLSAGADDFRVNSILNILSVDSEAQYAAAETDPNEFGLAPPRATLHLNDRRLDFGSTDPLERRRYVRLDDTLHLVDDTVLPLLTGGAATLIDRRLLPERLDIIRFELPDFSVRRTEAGGWTIKPAPDALNTAALENWVDRWRRAEASGVEHRPAMQPSSAPPVRLQPADGDALEYHPVRRDNERGFYRPDTGLYYSLNKTTLNELLDKPSMQSENKQQAPK